MVNKKEINENNLQSINGSDRLFQLWNLQDSLGKKELNNSLQITKSLLRNGIHSVTILMSLNFLFQQILWRKMGQKGSVGYTGINKIITSNISSYNKTYSENELIQVIKELRKLDLLSKSTSINDESLIIPLIIKVCTNQYV